MIVGPIYLDASAWVKVYLPETDSLTLEKALIGRRDLIISDLGVTEVVSAICRSRASGGAAVAAGIQRRLMGEIAEGAFAIAHLGPGVHREAENYLMWQPGLRAADALHLALARSAGTKTLACFDVRMRKAGEALGLDLFPA